MTGLADADRFRICIQDSVLLVCHVKTPVHLVVPFFLDENVSRKFLAKFIEPFWKAIRGR